MARSSFLIRGRGLPPFRILAQALASQEDFLADLRAILKPDESQFKALSKALIETDSFLDRKTLSDVVDSVLGTGEESNTIAGLIRQLSQMLRDSEESLTESLRVLEEAIAEHAKKEISEKERKELADRLKLLVAEPLGLARQSKAERLAEATGKELEDFQIVCDIRPVFDENRSRIEGAIPISTLRLDVVELDDVRRSLEVRLTEQQISDLCDKAESARKKIAVIKATLDKKEIVLPVTPATINERVAE